MNQRILGKTGFEISEIGLGTWQVGGGWGGDFDPKAADKIIHTALEEGINFIDTADVYDAGQSEAAVGKAIKQWKKKVFVATKCGRQINPHVSSGYQPDILRQYVEASLKNMGLERIDLIQLHCPPTEVYRRDEIFELFDRLKTEGKIHHMGVSVEKVEEARMAMQYEQVSTVQIIFNMFRQKPAAAFFAEAKAKDVGIIVRVPLASGLLTGKLSRHSQFDPADHRAFNREGAAFDKGETFSGVPYELGLQAVEELQELFEGDVSLAVWALRWVLMFPEVSTVIPGASKPEQVVDNVKVSGMPGLKASVMDGVKAVYERLIKKEVHQLW